jgi:Protein of unknown function (DUF1360)
MEVEAQSRPYETYAGLVAAFVGTLAAAGVLARALGRDPREQSALDLAVLLAANFKAARTLTHDEVTSWIRQPFVRRDPRAGREEPVEDQGLRQALGELVTCSRCIGVWTSVGLTSTQVLAPRFGRLVNWSLAIGGANDFLQAGFAALTAKANALEQRASS